MGTELQKRGLKPGEAAELFNFTSPQKVAEVNRAYAEAGSDIISANTFCANRYKLSDLSKTPHEVIATAVEIARKAVSDFPDVLVAHDIGPIGQLLCPTGTLSFDEAYVLFAEQVKAGVKAGADLVALQTFSDLLELKAAILAVKENSDLPVICSMTFEDTGRTFTGCPVSAFAITASGLGADLIGVNCSLGPKELSGIANELLRFSQVPVALKPNAGLPDPVTGEFGLNADEFTQEMLPMAKSGVKLLGGCCGTTPEHIRQLRKAVTGLKPVLVKPPEIVAVCSGTKTVLLDQPRVIGERINPTGKKLFKEALKNNDTDYILGQAFEQIKAGADILDVNVGLPEIDECKMMLTVTEALQSVCDLPLQIDSSDPLVIETALRRYNGKAIVNSVNGKAESLSAILPIVKKYGASVIGLTLDNNGIPDTAEERLQIARSILEAATSYGISKEDVLIDCLTMTVSTNSKAALTTLEAVRLVKAELGCKTTLGVSNVSFGLPQRGILNATFLTQALHNGLDLPIINPNAVGEMNAVRAFKALNDYDINSEEYIKAYSDSAGSKIDSAKPDSTKSISISDAVIAGLKKDALSVTENLLQTLPALEIINEHLIPALDKVGSEFESGKLFLPQLIRAAETVGVCFDLVRTKVAKSGETGNSDEASESINTIILATVQGDIHDIGKNIVKVLLQNYGYKIIDLGKDVAPETIVDCAIENAVKLIGLSALMTTTLPPMEQTIELLKSRGHDCKVMVGGAVLNADYAKSIGADFYAKDAKGAVDIAKSVF